MTELILSIYDPNTLLPHRAGIAGLALALSSMQKEKALVKWEVTEDEVKLAWECTDREAVQWLVENTYKIADGGYLDVPALKLDRQGLHSFTEGILQTFLQFGPGRKLDTAISVTMPVDDMEISVNFRPLIECYYTKKLKDEFDSKGKLKEQISLGSKHLPGLIRCYINGDYKESPSAFLALLFLPLACLYHKLPGARSTLVIPEIHDLKKWINRKQEYSGRTYRNFRCSGAGESGLQFLWLETMYEDSEIFKVDYCEVYQLGKQTWDPQQKYIKQAVYRVRAKPKNIEVYDSARQFFKPQVKNNANNEPFLAISKALAWICDNLIADRCWYSGFYEFRKRNGLYERKGLVNMTTNYLNADEQILFDAVQGSFSFYLAKQFEFRKSSLNRDLNKKEVIDVFSKSTEKVVHRLQHPNTQQEFAKALVKFLSDFPSKPGRGVGDRIYLWLHRGSNWRQGKDLTLLAIATYKSKKGDPLDGQEIPIESISEVELENDENEDI
jgi:CRISPR-associated protein Cas8a1/Csx13